MTIDTSRMMAGYRERLCAGRRFSGGTRERFRITLWHGSSPAVSPRDSAMDASCPTT
jgi:hypothetical protein